MPVNDQTNVRRLRAAARQIPARPEVAVDDLDRGRSAGRSRHSKSTQRKLRRLQVALVVCLCLLSIGTVATIMTLERRSDEREQLIFQVRKLERGLAEANTEIEQLRSDRDSLVAGRMPDLQPLSYDQILPVERAYVRNIAFTLTKQDESEAHEFRLVLSNEAEASVVPRLSISLFDANGAEIGMTEVSAAVLSQEGGQLALAPGEVRSHSGVIALQKERVPKYYQLQIY